MRIAQREDFALEIMGYLAKNNSGEFISLSRVAKDTRLSVLFIKHIALRLKEKKLLTSKEGIDGGYKLTRSPAKITISEIMEALSENLITPACDSGSCRLKSSRCKYSRFWRNVNNRMFAYLKSIKLSDIMSDRLPA